MSAFSAFPAHRLIFAVSLFILSASIPVQAQAPPAGTQCAFEGEVCKVQGTQDVSYGFRNNWVTKTVRGSIACSVAGFGKDPGGAGRRSCRINSQQPPKPAAEECAKEGEQCVFLGMSEVAYGAGDRWISKTTSNAISCSNTSFGSDPAPGVAKVCVVMPVRCATEGEVCSFRGIRSVKYGANNSWVSKTFRDGVTCGVAAFGSDPAENVLKQCYLAPVDEKPINEVMWLGAHNAMSSTYYGYTIHNSQRDSVTAQLDRGARSVEIDIVQDQPPAYPAGVYVCHCGKGPHSLSTSQSTRDFGDGPGQRWSPITIDGWTHGTPYLRFSTFLEEIDRWMTANPREIVIALIENNGAKPDEFDAEVSSAKLKTRIYRHTGGDWPTKSQLIKNNQRLILQIGDDNSRALKSRGAAHESAYASAKYEIKDKVESELIQYGWLGPAAYGYINQYTKARADAARNGKQLLIIGAFNSTLTDETTSKAHNQYSFLLGASVTWNLTTPLNKFFPSVLQVNQIHMGDPLRFVNDMNGPDYLVSSKVENIGDNTGDSWQIRFENDAVFNAGITIVYYEDVVENGAIVSKQKQVSSGALSPSVGVVRMINIPKRASAGKPISVVVSMYSTTEFALYSELIPANFVGSPVPCFSATGVLTSPKAGRCER